MELTNLLLAGSALLLLCVGLVRLLQDTGVPVLVLFLGVGMVVGHQGTEWIPSPTPILARDVGILCLALVLFAGGLDTDWRRSRPELGRAIALASWGVVGTALFTALAVNLLLGWDLAVGFLLGSILGSTDASAVFSVLRTAKGRLRPHLRRLLELESGINDPMAVLLVMGSLTVLLSDAPGPMGWVELFVMQMGVGAAVGLAAGWLLSTTSNRLHTVQEGLYPVLALATALFTFGVADALGGSGFLAVYLAGVTAANRDFVNRRSTERFFDGLSWLAQMTMYLILGLLVSWQSLLEVALPGLVLTAFLILVARPLAVFTSLLPFRLTGRDLVFTSWVGLRGAVPVVLATFPLLAGIPQAERILDLTFFAVLGSALLQGGTLPWVARQLGVLEGHRDDPPTLAEAEQSVHPNAEEFEIMVPFGSRANGKAILELHLPSEVRVQLLGRGDHIVVPEDGTLLSEGDILQVLAPPSFLPQVQDALSPRREEQDDAKPFELT